MNAAAIRRATPEDALAIAQVRIDSWRTTYRGMMPDAYLAAMKVDDSAAMWTRVLTAPRNAACVFVAVAAGEVVGFSSGFRLAEPKFDLDSELNAIYLRAEHQRAGVGHRLVGAVVASVRAMGGTGLLTWVIARNRAVRAFNERLGAVLLIEQPFQWDGMALVEAGYGWRDLDALALACGPVLEAAH